MKLRKNSTIHALLKTMRSQPTISAEDLLRRHPRVTKTGLKEIMHDFIITHDGRRWLLLPSLRDQMDILEGRVSDDVRACVVPPARVDLIGRPPMKCGVSAALEREKHRLRVGGGK